MSKEKFELVFLAGGALLDVLANRLRRPPANSRESVGAAVHALGDALHEHWDDLADPDAVAGQILAIREELCADRPHRLLLAGYLDELAGQVSAVAELVDAVQRVRDRVDDWLG